MQWARQLKSIPTISSSFDSFARNSKQGLRRRSTDRLDRVVSGETIKLLLLINRSSLVRNSLRIEKRTLAPRTVNNFRDDRKHTMGCENSISSRPLFLRGCLFYSFFAALFYSRRHSRTVMLSANSGVFFRSPCAKKRERIPL